MIRQFVRTSRAGIQGGGIGAAVPFDERENLGAAGVGRGGSGAGLRGERGGPERRDGIFNHVRFGEDGHLAQREGRSTEKMVLT